MFWFFVEATLVKTEATRADFKRPQSVWPVW